MRAKQEIRYIYNKSTTIIWFIIATKGESSHVNHVYSGIKTANTNWKLHLQALEEKQNKRLNTGASNQVF